MTHKQFTTGEFVVYPAHGVGKLINKEIHQIGDISVELLVISFDKERMTLRLPSHKAEAAGLRTISTTQDMQNALSILKVKIKQKRAMWSRRAQEYESKINSGDPSSIAQVVRELYRSKNDNDQSYSERQIYQAAIERLARELAAIEQTEESAAISKVEDILEAA